MQKSGKLNLTERSKTDYYQYSVAKELSKEGQDYGRINIETSHNVADS
jgi:hypothetical protein